MAKFKLTVDGATYMVDAPDEQSAAAALKKMRSREAIGGERGGPMDPLAQGASFGFADELAGGVAAGMQALGIPGALGPMSPGEAYEAYRDRARTNLEGYREDHPIASTALEIAGAVPTAVLPIGTVARGASLGAKVGRGAGVGAGYGGVYGTGAADDGLMERVTGAGGGIVLGSGVGAAFPVAGAAIGKGIAALRSGASQGGVSNRAARQIADDLAAEGTTVPEVAQRASDMGPDAMLADTSETLRLRAEQIAQSDNPARGPVIDRLKTRSRGAGARISQAYDASVGSTPNVHTTMTQMAKRTKDNADALYEQARVENAPVNVAPVIAKIDELTLSPLDDVVNPRSQLPADDVDGALAWLRGQLTTGTEQRTGIKQLDRLERRLRARVDSAFRSGKTDVGHALNEAAKILRQQMKGSSNTYRLARETFSDDRSVEDAFDAGLDLFAKGKHPDFLAAEIAEMSLAERDALRLGVRAAIAREMGSVRNGALKGRTLLDSDFNEQKLRAVLGEDADNLIQALLGEQEMASTANQALGNSATSRRMDNPFRAQQSNVPKSELRSFFNLNFGDAAARLGERLTNASKDRQGARLAQDMAPILTSTGSHRDALVRALMARANAVGAGRKVGGKAERMANAILGTGGRAGSPAMLEYYQGR